MGPVLICDKSTLQGLARGELNVLRKYYQLNIPPVLLAEVLGDLKKTDRKHEAQEEVRRLAGKIIPACSNFNLDYGAIIYAELLGKKVGMDGRPVVGGAKLVKKKDGKLGLIAGRHSMASAINRWQRGDFLEAEHIVAENWRRVGKSIDLESVQRQFRNLYSKNLRLKTIEDVCQFVDDLILCSSTDILLNWLESETFFDTQKKEDISKRLIAVSEPKIQSVAPYTAYCIRVGLVFHFALVLGLVTTRPTNRIDLEYLYFLPFCHAFSSGDKLHSLLAPHFLNSKQIFIERDVLLSDLRTLKEWWNGLSESEQMLESTRQGPPANDASVTHLIWSKVMNHGYRDPIQIPPEIATRLYNEIKPDQESMLPMDGSPYSPDDIEFIVEEHEVRSSGPCICGSEKTFAECCGRQLVNRSSAS